MIIYGGKSIGDSRNGDIEIFEPPDGLQPSENDVVIVELEGHGQWMVKRLKINLDTEKLEIKGILLRIVREFKKRLFLK